MEIPPQKTTLPQVNATQKSPSPASEHKVSDLKDLQLKPGQVYTAKVQQLASAHQSTSAQPLTRAEQQTTAPISSSTPTNPTTSSTTSLTSQAPQTPLTTQADSTQTQTEKLANEWLLKLNGKLIKVSSEKALSPGQTLHLQLDPNSSSTRPSLLVNTLNKLGIPESNGEPNKLSNQATTQLLNAINQVLLKQVSLEQGLTELKAFQEKLNVKTLSTNIQSNLKQAPLSQLNLTSTSNDEPRLARPQTAATQAPSPTSIKPQSGPQLKAVEHAHQVNKLILQSLPKLSVLLESINTGTPSNSAQTIRNTLQQSGLFFESSLPKPNNLSQFSTQIDHINKSLLNPSIQAPGTESLAATPPQNMRTATLNDTNTINKALKQIHALQESYKAYQHKSPQDKLSFDKLQEITARLKGAEITPEFKDMKGTLFSLSAALISSLKADKSAINIHEILSSAFSQDDLLQTPFNFPNLRHPQSSKTESLLAKQEFTTGQLLKLLASMINRLQFNQLNSLYQSQSQSTETLNTQSWFFELPLLVSETQVNTFNLRLDKEEANQQKEDTEKQQTIQWKLALSFDFEDLGPIYIQVSLSPPVISSTIWADKEETLTLVKKESTYLRARLKGLDLEVADIFCQKGQPKQQQAKLDRSLVDVKA